ncbi:MAG TPA: tRNA guanosine(34) transglycosylase Tgt [Thermomicrobiales bacterium]|nr:tRNA guanosine(34) transglycosylase Tgt [Thermomicrobiales bacterium]
MSSRVGISTFTVSSTDGHARAGELRLPRGVVRTPAFMPVGTQASVKALDPADILAIGSEIILANTYHLMLRPGANTIETLGGVSHFMRWEGPVLTDSGGFQVFSLARNRTLSDDGVTFRSHIDGSLHALTPERAISMQRQFGSDIIMALDVLAGYGASDAEQKEATRLTHAWLPRNVDEFRRDDAAGQPSLLFGICQGGFNPERRRESARIVASAKIDGCAIGGLSVGEPKTIMAEMLRASIDELPVARPRYLMGVGSPEDLWRGVATGVDMFDCVLPTRVARRGGLYTLDGRVNVTASRFAQRDEPIDVECDCATCRVHSVAYVHHLFRAGELLAFRLATIHNLRFIQRVMERMRAAIRDGTFQHELTVFLDRYQPANELVAAEQRARDRVTRGRASREPMIDVHSE